MIEKILEFHCIVLVCDDYEIVLRKGCNQKQNELIQGVGLQNFQ
jgi:hypothetical protein